LNVFLCLINGFFIISCAGQQTGDARLVDIARYKTGMAYGLAIKGSYAYITTNNDLLIIDIANPRKPKRISKLSLGQPVFALRVQDSNAYLAASDNGLVIVNISDPENPEIIGRYYDGGSVQRLDLEDHYCITSDFENGLNILDISNISTPVKVSNLKYNRIWTFVATNNLVFLIDAGKGLRIVDISDKTNPAEMTLVDETQEASSVAIDGSRLFLVFLMV